MSRASSTCMPGYDPDDELTAFSLGTAAATAATTRSRMPARSRRRTDRRACASTWRKDLFSIADYESIDIVDAAIKDLAALGATIVDPGPTRCALPELRRQGGSRSGAIACSSASSRQCSPTGSDQIATADRRCTSIRRSFRTRPRTSRACAIWDRPAATPATAKYNLNLLFQGSAATPTSRTSPTSSTSRISGPTP